MALHKRLNFLGYLLCIIVTWMEKSWSVVWHSHPWHCSCLPLPNICISSTNQPRCLLFYSACLLKLLWWDFCLITPVHCYPLKMADFYCACIVPRPIHKLYKIHAFSCRWYIYTISLLTYCYAVHHFCHWKGYNRLHWGIWQEMLLPYTKYNNFSTCA